MFHHHTSTRGKVMLALAGLVLTLTGLTVALAKTMPPPPSTTGMTATPTAVADVAAQLDQLPTRSYDADAPLYDRDAFGPAWADEDHNGCDTRNDILARDLKSVEFKDGTHNCVVLSGVLNPDPYTGQEITFTRGQNTSSEVQIDHVVSLADAWYAGAYDWSNAERLTYANDPLVLLAVDGGANQAKSASRADEWLPDGDFACEYVSLQIEIKATYNLAVTNDERAAMTQVLLNNCP